MNAQHRLNNKNQKRIGFYHNSISQLKRLEEYRKIYDASQPLNNDKEDRF